MTTHNIPPRFHDARLETFQTLTSSQAAALSAVRAWIDQVESGPMLALIGEQGTGKSHLLYAAALTLIRRIEALDARERIGRPYPFVAPWYRLADELRYGRVDDTPAGAREVSGAGIRASLWERRIVMLDEVRRTSGTDFDDTELVKFACHAYDNRIAVLITTNWSPLAEVMGPAAASRFTQVEITAPDFRQRRIA